MGALQHKTTFAEQFMSWQVMERDSELVLVVSLHAIGGMTVALPVPTGLEGLPFEDPDWVIIVDRIERMFWTMHGSNLCAEPTRKEAAP